MKSKNIIIDQRPMICGQSEVQLRRYHKKVDSKNNIWLYADQLNSADNIYFCPKGGSKNGFGGATLQFTLIDGTIEKYIGPWHSNSNSLFV